jgi:hypothetical protein
MNTSKSTINKSAKRRAAGTPALSPKQKQQVRAMLSSQLETKQKTFGVNAVAVTTAGTCYDMTALVQDNTESGRVGDRVQLKSVDFRYTITVGATGLIAAADQFNTVRVIIFKWRENDAVDSPTTAKLLDVIAGYPTSILLPNRNLEHQYKVYYDKTHVVYNTPLWNGAAVAWYHGVGGTMCTDNHHISGPLGFIEFEPPAGFQGEGNLYLFVGSDSAFAPNPTITCLANIRYTDA